MIRVFLIVSFVLAVDQTPLTAETTKPNNLWFIEQTRIARFSSICLTPCRTNL
jgi:hypothetical protein